MSSSCPEGFNASDTSSTFPETQLLKDGHEADDVASRYLFTVIRLEHLLFKFNH